MSTSRTKITMTLHNILITSTTMSEGRGICLKWNLSCVVGSRNKSVWVVTKTEIGERRRRPKEYPSSSRSGEDWVWFLEGLSWEVKVKLILLLKLFYFYWHLLIRLVAWIKNLSLIILFCDIFFLHPYINKLLATKIICATKNSSLNYKFLVVFIHFLCIADTFDELNITWYTSLVWYTGYVVDTFAKFCKYTHSHALSHGTLDVLSVHLLWFVHSLNGFNTILINILYFIATLDRFIKLDAVHMFDTLDHVLLVHFLYLSIHLIDLNIFDTLVISADTLNIIH